MGFLLEIEHVGRHQDQKTAYHNLPHPAQLNLIADEKALEMLTHVTGKETYCEFIANKVTLLIGHEIVNLQEAYLSQDLQEYMTKTSNRLNQCQTK
jgi:hypothetical protein